MQLTESKEGVNHPSHMALDVREPAYLLEWHVMELTAGKGAKSRRILHDISKW